MLEFVEGVFEKSGTIPSAADNAQRSAMYVSLIDTLAKIHAVDIDKVGLEAYGKRRDPAVDVRESGYIARQVKVGR
jgi:aminoglycoside phosphotransferase (APT) family kinase protein